MQPVLLTITRFSLCAWVGAATLYVAVGIREVKNLEDPVTVDELVALRFPAYYAFGFGLVAIALVAAFLLRGDLLGRRRRQLVLALAAAALAMMIVDYLLIYQPLLDMIVPAGREKTAAFTSYHNASKYVNLADVGLCLIAAFVACLPRRREQ